MKTLPFQEPPVPKIMLSELRPSRPVVIDSHSHIKLKGSHDHSHSQSKKCRRKGDHGHFGEHHRFMKLERLVSEGPFYIELWL